MFDFKLTYTNLLICVSICAFGLYWVNAACDVCQENGAACVNLTAFHLCFGGSQPHRDQLFVCKDGLQCTVAPNICFQATTTLPASCGDISSCGRCNENQVFACTSRYTFAFCFGATTPSTTTGACPNDKICDASAQEICVSEVHSNSIVCDLEAP